MTSTRSALPLISSKSSSITRRRHAPAVACNRLTEPTRSEQEQQQAPTIAPTRVSGSQLPAEEASPIKMRREGSSRNDECPATLGTNSRSITGRIRCAGLRARMSAPYTKQTLVSLAGVLLLASSLVCANYAPLHQLNQHQQLEQLSASDAAAYQNQGPHQQQQPAKAKKIQIVYIKVPLAKLKPSLPADGVEHTGAASAPKNFTTYAATNQQYNSTAETKPQGSQLEASSQLEQQQQQLSGASRSQQPSFLIPMAVISSGDNDTPNLQQQQQAAYQADSDSEEVLVRTGRRSPHPRGHQSPMQLYQQQQQQQQLWASSSPFATSGFMSSFLQAEKERLTNAALRLQPADQPAPSNTHLTTTHANSQHQHQNNHKPGGLMPVMMMPFSHMPDNMIGQAYNAAVGQALPLESGSPGTILGSSASSLSHNTANTNANSEAGPHGNKYAAPGNQLGQQPSASLGGEHGTLGDSGSSHSTGSTGFYGSTGQRQQDASSSASGYRSSAFASGASGPSSGYGNGINTFGASVAFTDFPATLSSASNGYGQLHSNSNSNNNLYNSHPSNQLSGSGDSALQAEYGKLRQAKKTIIPIVVQVEHAIMESNALAHNLGKQVAASVQAAGGNRYAAGLRGHRGQPLAGLGGNRQRGYRQQHGKQLAPNQHQQQLYGSASNEVPMGGGPPAQYLNAANAQDINQITAAINAENAASAAAALAQADMALGQGGPAYMPNHMENGHPRPQHHHSMSAPRPHQPLSGYASGLQSAASALLANSHPMLQAAASGGLASVSKLGAKLGEMMALPSMQMGNPIAALPSAFSSLTNQMGAQLNQAVQQVAKEYPAGAFARQVAQLNQAGMQLAYGSLGGLLPQKQQQQQSPQSISQYFSGPSQQQQQLQAAGSQQSSSILSSPQSHIQNLKLSIGQNLQSAAAQMLGPQKSSAAQNVASTLLANPLSALYPPVVNSALKTMSGGLAMAASQSASPSFALPGASDQQQLQQQQQPQQQQAQNNPNQQQQQQMFQVGPDGSQSLVQQSFAPEQQQQVAPEAAKPAGKSSLKSKFLSFFQPPKFISNLLNWNDHASSRNDQVSESSSSTKEQEESSGKLESGSAVAKDAKDAKVEPQASLETKSTSAETKSVDAASSSSGTVAAAAAAGDASENQKKD